jgi:TRAP-type transport system periplasmic protein
MSMSFYARAATAFALLLAFAAPVFADEPVVVLKFATLSTADGPLNQRMLHPWAERVNAAGKGIVQLDVRDGFAIANYNNIYDRVLDDVVQIAFTVTGSVAGKFALAGVVDLPFLFERPDDASVAYWRLYQSGALDSEYTEIVPLYLVTLANSGLRLDRLPHSPDDIRGFKIVSSSRVTSQIVEALGATPISLQQNEMYTALQRRAVDGTYGAWTSFPALQARRGDELSYRGEAWRRAGDGLHGQEGVRCAARRGAQGARRQFRRSGQPPLRRILDEPR